MLEYSTPEVKQAGFKTHTLFQQRVGMILFV